MEPRAVAPQATRGVLGKAGLAGGPGLRVLVIGSQLSPFSGTSKVSLEIIRGLKEIGCTVKAHFFSGSQDLNLLGGLLIPECTAVFGSRFTRLVSTAIQLPLIGTVWKHGFTADDAVDVLGALTNRGLLREIRETDLVLFMNFWAAFPVLTMDSTKPPRTAVFFHETPAYSEVPPVAKQVILGLIHKLARSCDLVVSVSDRIQSRVEAEAGLRSRVLYPGIRPSHSLWTKQGFVLMDTRWTDSREPEFAAELARILPETRFVIAGHFPSSTVRERFNRALSTRGVEGRVKVLTELSEEQLDDLYSQAQWYVRWSAKPGEAGPSFGIFQAIGNLCPPLVDRELGGSDFLIKNGLADLVVDRDPQAFATRLLTFEHASAAYAELLRRLQKVRSENGWASYCARLIAFATNDA